MAASSVPPSWETKLIETINAAPDCSTLKAIEDDAVAYLQEKQDQLTVKLAEFKAKWVPSESKQLNVANMFTWVTDLVQVFIDSYNKMSEELTELSTSIANVKAAIDAKYGAMTCSNPRTSVEPPEDTYTPYNPQQ
jgi:hypothetical protein